MGSGLSLDRERDWPRWPLMFSPCAQALDLGRDQLGAENTTWVEA
jgi:hypothetical protein